MIGDSATKPPGHPDMADKLAAAESRYSAFTRDSILSDPRLSQVCKNIFLNYFCHFILVPAFRYIATVGGLG